MASSSDMTRYESQNRVAKSPKAPLTAYNLYFQVERKRILEGTDSLGLPITHEEIQLVAAEFRAKTGKRVHRKTHGKIGFKELARVVASRWKELDSETKEKLLDHARIEKEEHSTQLQEWKKTEEYKKEQADQCQAEISYPSASGANVHRDVSGAAFYTSSVESYHGMSSDLELFRAMWNEHDAKNSVVSQKNTQDCFVMSPQGFPQQQPSPQMDLLSFVNVGSFPFPFFADNHQHAPTTFHRAPWGHYQQLHGAGQQEPDLDEDEDLFEPVPLFEPGSAQQPSSYMGV